jgi:ankyrin repeat protein
MKRISLILIAGALSLQARKNEPSAAPALFEAIYAGDVARIEKILERGADPNAKNPEGSPALAEAALYADARAVTTLLQHGADPNVRDARGATALIFAAGDRAKALPLLAKGASVNVRTAAGRTPLLIAAGVDGNYDVVKAILDRGADVNEKDLSAPFIPTIAGAGGGTALIAAAYTPDSRTLGLLLEKGAAVDARDNLDQTALLAAAIGGSVENAKLLLARGADPNAISKMGMTPLIVAAMIDRAEIARELVAHGAKVNAHDLSGATPLMWAAYTERGDTAIVRMLLAAGADPKDKNAAGETALTWAARRGYPEVMKLLGGAEVAQVKTEPAPDAKADPRVIRAAIEKALALVQKSQPQFVKVSGCVSCHNQSLPAMAVSVARARGFHVDDAMADQQKRVTLGMLKPMREAFAQNIEAIPDLPVTGSYLLMGVAAEDYAPDAVTTAVTQAIASKQASDGRWIGWGMRPPIERGDITSTALTIKALRLYAPEGRAAEFNSRVVRARDWLLAANAVTGDERAMRVFGLAWSGAERAQLAPAVKQLLAAQRPDGGWSQLPGLASDAYATGQALAALRESGAVASSDAAYRRGVNFLLSTQLEDGSWLVKTRSFPLQPYKESGFPHGKDQWISAAGTSWAAMALAFAAD